MENKKIKRNDIFYLVLLLNYYMGRVYLKLNSIIVSYLKEYPNLEFRNWRTTLLVKSA